MIVYCKSIAIKIMNIFKNLLILTILIVIFILRFYILKFLIKENDYYYKL